MVPGHSSGDGWEIQAEAWAGETEMPNRHCHKRCETHGRHQPLSYARCLGPQIALSKSPCPAQHFPIPPFQTLAVWLAKMTVSARNGVFFLFFPLTYFHPSPEVHKKAHSEECKHYLIHKRWMQRERELSCSSCQHGTIRSNGCKLQVGGLD